MIGMALRVHGLCWFGLYVALASPTRADGPPPINTTRSVSAGADDDIITAGDTRTPTGSEHASGTYTGVVPGSATPSRAAQALGKGKGAAVITWPGFQMRPDGSSRVFIQSTTQLDPQPMASPGRYQLHLPGARIGDKTNRLPLDTRYFNTPVTKVSLSPGRSGATVSLELRADVTPQISTERGTGGEYFVYIELPKGSYVANATAQASNAANAGRTPATLPESAPPEPGAPPAAVGGPPPEPAAAPAKAHGELHGRIKLHD
jgi:hypothetical protein